MTERQRLGVQSILAVEQGWFVVWSRSFSVGECR